MYPGNHRYEARIHPEWDACLSQDTHTTDSLRDARQPIMHDFVQREETGETLGTPREHVISTYGEMETCSTMEVLTTKPPWHNYVP